MKLIKNLTLYIRMKRTPQQQSQPLSLQAMLANHRIDTNVLKTRAQLRQPGPLKQILTPQQESRYKYSKDHTVCHPVINLNCFSVHNVSLRAA